MSTCWLFAFCFTCSLDNMSPQPLYVEGTVSTASLRQSPHGSLMKLMHPSNWKTLLIWKQHQHTFQLFYAFSIAQITKCCVIHFIIVKPSIWVSNHLAWNERWTTFFFPKDHLEKEQVVKLVCQLHLPSLQKGIALTLLKEARIRKHSALCQASQRNSFLL